VATTVLEAVQGWHWNLNRDLIRAVARAGPGEGPRNHTLPGGRLSRLGLRRSQPEAPPSQRCSPLPMEIETLSFQMQINLSQIVV
jgi:hypothetical protein